LAGVQDIFAMEWRGEDRQMGRGIACGGKNQLMKGGASKKENFKMFLG